MKRAQTLQEILEEISFLSCSAIEAEREAVIRYMSEAELEEAEEIRTMTDPDQLSFDKKYATPEPPDEPSHPNRLRYIP